MCLVSQLTTMHNTEGRLRHFASNEILQLGIFFCLLELLKLYCGLIFNFSDFAFGVPDS